MMNCGHVPPKAATCSIGFPVPSPTGEVTKSTSNLLEFVRWSRSP